MQQEQLPRSISFSSLKTWKECPYKFYLNKIVGISDFDGNGFTVVGNAVHAALEYVALHFKEYETLENLSWQKVYAVYGEEYINICKNDNIEFDLNMFKQGYSLIDESAKFVFDKFDITNKENICGIEYEFNEKIENCSYNILFRGYADLVLHTKDDRYVIIDYKVTSWGWDAQKKNDTMTTYQLALYKLFFARKLGIDPEQIDLYFVLLKRTQPAGKRCELVPVPCGIKKLNNAEHFLISAVESMKRNPYVKNRLSCKFCRFNSDLAKYCKKK